MITVNIPVLDIMVFVCGFMAGYLVYVVRDCINEWRFKQDKTILEKMETEINTMQNMKKVRTNNERKTDKEVFEKEDRQTPIRQ